MEKVQSAVIGFPAFRPVPVADFKDMSKLLPLGTGPEQSLVCQRGTIQPVDQPAALAVVAVRLTGDN